MKAKSQVFLNIYELEIFLFGVTTLYHTSIEYDGIEYSFGICQYKSDVYECIPKQSKNGRFIKSISFGWKTRRNFFISFEKIKKEYLKKSYNLFTYNCNHFSNDYLKCGFKKEIPYQFQSFLKLGEFFR